MIARLLVQSYITVTVLRGGRGREVTNTITRVCIIFGKIAP